MLAKSVLQRIQTVKMNSDEQDCRRQFHRVAVPVGEFVLLETQKQQYKVTEISEGGLCLESQNDLPLGTLIRGKLFYDGKERFMISGQVLRSEKMDNSNHFKIVVKASTITTPTVIAFQSYIIRTYGTESADDE
jgi:hypothetical protein